MVQQDDGESGPVGVYLNPLAERRAAFERACAPLFGRLALAASAADCLGQAGRERPRLLVIDLEGFDRAADGEALDKLVLDRALGLHGAAAPTLLLYPAASAGWLADLARYGGTGCAVTPLDAAQLRARVAHSLAGGDAAPDPGRAWRLSTLPGRAQGALAGAPDLAAFTQRLCAALCDPSSGWPGMVHAAVFHLQPGAGLRLAAQAGKPGLLLEQSQDGAVGLDGAALRHAFPALRAAADGAAVLADVSEQAGDPALAQALREHGVALALGLPILSDGPAPPRGALSLLFDESRSFTQNELALLDDIAHLAGFGMRLFDTAAENDALLGRLAHATTTDALTGIPNRRHGEDLLEKEIRRARRYRLPLALVAIDIDRFKDINDTYGYPVGDVALRLVADTTRALLRASDVLVRTGGEEFQVIAPHTSATDGLRMAEKIRLAIEATAFPGCDRVTVSLGVAQLSEQESGDSLTRRTDAALARAKRAGRNCVELAMQ